MSENCMKSENVRNKIVTHVQYRRRTWRIASADFKSKETTYSLIVSEQAYLLYL